MIARTRKGLRRHPVRTGVVLAGCALITAVALANTVDAVRYLRFRTALDVAPAVASGGRRIDAGWTFRFVQGRYRVSVAVDEAELAAARAVDTDPVFGSRGWLRQRCVADIVRAESETRLIEELAGEFRRIRDLRQLTDDEYLELITSAVQQIPYARASRGLQLPAEVLASGVGICTDKSLLLGSLLLHEGYDTVLFVFERPSHVALGVASNGARFHGTRYAFVESTVPRFIGQAGPEYRARGPITGSPQSIALGGWRSYGSGHEVDVILDELGRARRVQTAWLRRSRSIGDGETEPRVVREEIEDWVARAMTSFILANTHDRGNVYAMLRGQGAGPPGSYGSGRSDGSAQ